MKRYSAHNKCWEAAADMADRGLQFGDGVFETMRRRLDGQIPLLDLHLKRLSNGLEALGFGAEVTAAVSDIVAEAVLNESNSAANESSSQQTGIKIIVTRGSGPRGYAPPESVTPAIYLSTFDAPTLKAGGGIVVGESHVRLGHQPLLAGLKHLNRLEQVLARQSFKSDWNEALMFCQAGLLIEGCMSNVFVKIDGQWITPELNACGVSGVVRQWLLGNHGEIAVGRLDRSALINIEAMFMTNSLTGIRPVQTLNGQPLGIPAEVVQWQAEYMRLFDER